MFHLTKESVSSKYRVEPESKKSNVNDILNWLSIIRKVTPSFKVFHAIYMRQFGRLSERGGTQKERGGVGEVLGGRGGGCSLRNGGVPTLEELWYSPELVAWLYLRIYGFWILFNIIGELEM